MCSILKMLLHTNNDTHIHRNKSKKELYYLFPNDIERMYKYYKKKKKNSKI